MDSEQDESERSNSPAVEDELIDQHGDCSSVENGENENDDSRNEEAVLEKSMRRMLMDFSRVKIVHGKSINAVKPVQPDEPYHLARLKKQAMRNTLFEEEINVDESATEISKMLCGDDSGPIIERASLSLEIAGNLAAALVVVQERVTDTPLITYAMTHWMHRRQGCMSILVRIALSELKMLGHDVCYVDVNVNDQMSVPFFRSCGFEIDALSVKYDFE